MKYLGYEADIRYSAENGTYSGKIAYIPELVSFEGKTYLDAAREFIHAVHSYKSKKG